MDLGSAIELEAMTQALLMQSDDHREFYAAWSRGSQAAVDRAVTASTRSSTRRSSRSRSATRTPCVAAPGRTVYLGGQTASGPTARRGTTIAEQFDAAAATSSTALQAAGGEPETSCSLVVFVTDVDEYSASLRRARARSGGATSGAAIPAMALVGASRPLRPGGAVELMGVAVVP